MQTVTIRTPEDLRAIRARIEDPRPLLARIGLQLKRTSDRAFDEQRLGDFPWQPRYPSQAEPFVNFAAVLQRANRGQEPLDRDFDRRPALRGTGDLQKSVKARWEIVPGGALVEARSDLFYSGTHQKGGSTSFDVSQLARDTLRSWAIRKGAPAPGIPKPRGRRGKPDPRAKKILLLSYLHKWKQDVIARPFIGITSEAGKRITRIAEDFMARGTA